MPWLRIDDAEPWHSVRWTHCGGWRSQVQILADEFSHIDPVIAIEPAHFAQITAERKTVAHTGYDTGGILKSTFVPCGHARSGFQFPDSTCGRACHTGRGKGRGGGRHGPSARPTAK